MAAIAAIDTTLAKCPNYCLLPAGFGKTPTATREFLWHEDADAEADIGTRNYCPNCGAELVEA